MSPLRARFPLRGLSLMVFAVLVGGSAVAAGYARRVVTDQEERLLVQRASEASALLTNLVNQSQAATKSLAAVADATHGDPDMFGAAAGRDAAVAGGTGAGAPGPGGARRPPGVGAPGPGLAGGP